MKVLRVLFFVSVLVLCAAPSVRAQLIRGRILEQGNDRGVDGAEISLIDVTGATVMLAVSDSTGGFALSVPTPGLWRIAATRIGLTAVEAEVNVGEKELVEVELTMAPEAIPLEPIVVVGRRRIQQGTLDEFYDRMERMKRRGVGFFFTAEDIKRLERTDLPLMLQHAPGVFASSSGGGAGYLIQMAGRGGLCYPDIYLDGLPLSGARGSATGVAEGPSSGGLYPFGNGGGGAAGPRYNSIPVMDLEGVEIYRGRWEQPDGYWSSDCGIIFLWRKKGWGNPFSMQTLLLVGGVSVVTGLLLSLLL